MSLDTLGYTHNTIAITAGSDGVTLSESFKNCASSDWGLQLDPMKLELLVIAGQIYRGEYVLKSCTRVAMRSSTLVGENPTKAIYSALKRNHSLYPARDLDEGRK